MAARKWTPEQRAKQSKAIQTWQPWQHSTGAKSATGKATVSRNAYRGGTRQFCRFAKWVFWAINHPDTLTPEIVEAAKQRCNELCNGSTEWIKTTEAKAIAILQEATTRAETAKPTRTKYHLDTPRTPH